MQLVGDTGVYKAKVDSAGRIATGLFDAAGNAIFKARNEALDEATYGLPAMAQFLPGRRARFNRADSIGSLRTQDPWVRFIDPVEGSTINTAALWTSTATIQSLSQSNSQLILNSASTLTNTTGVMLVSQQKFDHRPGQILRYRSRARVSWGTTGAAGTNGIAQFGFGQPASQTVATVTNGLFVRATGSGALQFVFAFGSSETTLATIGIFASGVISGGDLASGKTIRVDSYYLWEISLGDDWALLQVIDPADGVVIYDKMCFLPNITTAGLLNASHTSAFLHTLVSGVAANSAVSLVVNEVVVSQLDANLGLSHENMMAGLQRVGTINPTTYVQTPNYTNSAAPTSATLSNTAAGYTTLGGQWQFVAVGGAETDYCLFGYTVPTPYRLRIKRIAISAFNMGAIVATTPHLLQWSLAFNSSAVSLAGTLTRETIGAMGIAVGGAIGQPFDRECVWQGDRVIEPGRLLQVFLKMPIASATASQIIRGTCQIDGYFE